MNKFIKALIFLASAAISISTYNLMDDNDMTFVSFVIALVSSIFIGYVFFRLINWAINKLEEHYVNIMKGTIIDRIMRYEGEYANKLVYEFRIQNHQEFTNKSNFDKTPEEKKTVIIHTIEVDEITYYKGKLNNRNFYDPYDKGDTFEYLERVGKISGNKSYALN